MKLSVLILTYNEEINIRDCILSIPADWRGDMHVLDSYSSDRTVDIAQSLGAKVTKEEFKNYSQQRNIGLSLDFENEWVLMLDADERVTTKLASEIMMSVGDHNQLVDIFRVRRKDIFAGKWIKHSSGYPTYFPRLLRCRSVKVTREINEEYHCDGEVRNLREHLVHFPFNKGISWWFERHNIYSSMEAEKLLESRKNSTLKFLNLMSRDPVVRRRELKVIAYKLPLRPLLMFISLYVIKLGFLDGVAGYNYSIMRMSYEIMIDSKLYLIESAYADAGKSYDKL